MRNGTKVAIFAGLFTIFTVAVIGVGLWRSGHKPAAKRVATSSQTSANSNAAGALSLANNNGLGGGTEVAVNQNQSGAGQSATPTSASAPTIPGPESFGQYEQYKDSKTTMYMDLQAGNGAELTAGKKAAVLYKVWLTNGQLVDQTRTDPATGKLQAFSFTLGDHSVIPGWEQGVFGMKVNGTRRLVIPSSLAYGAQGNGGVPPNSMLIIDVQLVQVE